MRFIYFLLTPLILLCSCSQYGKVSFEKAPQVINVSGYDPKEIQKSGSRFSEHDVTALKKNGALGLIARCGKGYKNDTKCASFLSAAERSNMLLGTYFFVLPNISGKTQADQYIARLREIKKSHITRTSKVLLVADFDTKCSIQQMKSFLSKVTELTGVIPVVYLENGDTIRSTLKNASRKDKAFLRKHPYWLALYSTNHETYKTPQQLTKGSKVWNDWAMWQYAGVWWKNGRSVPYHYRGGSWNTPKYFGDLSQPSERNGFNGTNEELFEFWNKHSWNW